MGATPLPLFQEKEFIMLVRTIVSIAAVAWFTGCIFPGAIIHGSEDTVTASSSASDFTAVSVENACEATITRGDVYSVTVEINENIESHLNIENVNRTLYVTLDDGHVYNNLKFKVTITMPELAEVEGSGASEITVSGFDAATGLLADLSGASELAGNLDCGDVTLRLSGASTVELSGSGADVACEASGASEVDMRDFSCEDAYMNLSGASTMRVNAAGTISGDLSGASEVYYYGSPTVGSFDKSGASEVKRAD
jgi:hypothetical protein